MYTYNCKCAVYIVTKFPVNAIYLNLDFEFEEFRDLNVVYGVRDKFGRHSHTQFNSFTYGVERAAREYKHARQLVCLPLLMLVFDKLPAHSISMRVSLALPLLQISFCKLFMLLLYANVKS